MISLLRNFTIRGKYHKHRAEERLNKTIKFMIHCAHLDVFRFNLFFWSQLFSGLNKLH